MMYARAGTGSFESFEDAEQNARDPDGVACASLCPRIFFKGPLGLK